MSLAGRKVMAQSVLSTILYFVMQTTRLPKEICDSIDRSIRNFIWGGPSKERRCSLVKWEKVTQPKHRGGLGIRSTRDMNVAFMTKLGWRMLTEKDSLWAKVLINKYMGGKRDINSITMKNGASNAWRGIVEGVNTLREGMQKVPRNGKSTYFWNEPWLLKEPLSQHALLNITDEMSKARVADYWKANQGWDWSKIRDAIPEDILNKMEIYMLIEDNESEDDFCWREEGSGMFSVSSAYNLIHDNAGAEDDRTWERIWRLKVAAKMKMFLWLAYHQRVMSNDMRRRKGFTTLDHCHRCTEKKEDIDHILRRCPNAEEVWNRVVPGITNSSWWDIPFTEWMSTNLRKGEPTGNIRNWAEAFAIVCWWIWRWRNDEVFNDNPRSGSFKVGWIKDQIKDSDTAFTKAICPGKEAGTRGTRWLRWQRPEKGWASLDTDGCVDINTKS